AAIETEALENNFLLAIVKDVEQSTNLVAEIFISQELKRRLGILVADDFAELGGIIVADRRVEGSWTNRDSFELRNFSGRDSDFFAKLVIGRLAAKLLAHLQRDAAHLRDFINEMNWQANCLRLVSERTLNRLLDPPGSVGAKLAALRGIETFDCLHQADIAFGNQIKQRQPEVCVVMRDLYDQAQIGADHERARFAIAFLDFGGELNLLLRG